MSHKATIWAIQQRGLKPATKLVLWYLCDRHNPDFGCFPTQARLADDAEMSVSALNEHLARLEELRLIHRIRTHDPHTHRRQATRYILAFEEGFPNEPPPEPGDGAISGFAAEPSPDFAESHLRNPETNLVREPLRESVKEEGAQAREDGFETFFEDLVRALGFASDAELPPWWRDWPARKHVRRWIDDLGLTEDQVIDIAKATRRDHPIPPDGPKALDRAMQHAAQRGARPDATGTGRRNTGPRRRVTAPRPSEDELAAFYARMVNSDAFLPANTISNAIRNALLARGLVTPERLRERGVR